MEAVDFSVFQTVTCYLKIDAISNIDVWFPEPWFIVTTIK